MLEEQLINLDFDQQENQFAQIDASIFNEVNIIDSVKTIERINQLEDYKSFQDVIDQQKLENFPGKRIYKFKK